MHGKYIVSNVSAIGLPNWFFLQYGDIGITDVEAATADKTKNHVKDHLNAFLRYSAQNQKCEKMRREVLCHVLIHSAHTTMILCIIFHQGNGLLVKDEYLQFMHGSEELEAKDCDLKSCLEMNDVSQVRNILRKYLAEDRLYKAALLWTGTNDSTSYWIVGDLLKDESLILRTDNRGRSLFKGFDMGIPFHSIEMKKCYERMMNKMAMEALFAFVPIDTKINGLYVIKENPKPNAKKTRHTQNGRASCDNTKNVNDSSLGEVSTDDLLLETSLLEDDVSDISKKVDEIKLVKKKEDEERIMRQQIEDEITKARALQLAQQIEDENAKAHALKLATRKACKTWTKQPSDSSQKNPKSEMKRMTRSLKK